MPLQERRPQFQIGTLPQQKQFIPSLKLLFRIRIVNRARAPPYRNDTHIVPSPQLQLPKTSPPMHQVHRQPNRAQRGFLE